MQNPSRPPVDIYNVFRSEQQQHHTATAAKYGATRVGLRAEVEEEAHKVVSEPPAPRKHITKLEWHFFCLFLVAIVTTWMLVNGWDQEHPLVFGFGPVMPNFLMEVIDAIRRL